jgi:hypothetical protein
MRRTLLRGLFAVVLVAAAVQLGLAAVSSPNVVDRYQGTEGSTVAEPAPNATVVATSPREGTDASLFVVGSDGEMDYYEERYRQYFDVDPVPGTTATVEFVAKDRDVDCPTGTEPCADAVFVRVNASTGERTVFERFAAQQRADWHDFDRINETHLLIADINNRVRIYDTGRDLTVWSYNFRADYERRDGGTFPRDWTHLNDVEWLGDGRMMASPRNMDQVVFLDREDGLDESWSLGTDGNHSRLYEQHNPDYIPEARGGPAVVVADSENNRVVEYERRDGEWVRTWSWRDSEMSWPRSNGNRILELDTDGEVVWSIPVDTPYEAERLGTGDESADGPAASRADLRGTSASATSGPAPARGTDASLTSEVVIWIKSLLPSLVVNGLLFVLPGWMGSTELLVTALALGAAASWTTAELYWAGYRLRPPLSR